MADITMCINAFECCFRSSCYRAMAKPDIVWQSYAEFYHGIAPCENFWPADPKERKKRK